MILRAVLRHADRVISISSYTTNQVVTAQGLQRKKDFRAPACPRPGFLQAARDPDSLPLQPQSRILLTVGRLVSTEPGKPVDSVIRVLPEVLKAFPDVCYIVIDSGNLQARLEELARESPAHDRISFLGKVEFDKLTRHYSRCDVFVMPSRQEGFGIVLMKAMALGKPVLACDYGGSSEVVQNGVTGFLVNPDDSKALTERLVQLLQDEPLRTKMGEVGRCLVQQTYTFERFEERLTRVLDNGA